MSPTKMMQLCTAAVESLPNLQLASRNFDHSLHPEDVEITGYSLLYASVKPFSGQIMGDESGFRLDPKEIKTSWIRHDDHQ